MTSLFTRLSRRVVPGHVRHVHPVPHRDAQGLVAKVYDQMERDFGMIAPPVALHAPAPTVLSASWVLLREILLVDGRVNRATKEAVAAAVSLGNRCPYCVDVHSTTFLGLVGGDEAQAVAADRIDTIADPRLRELVRWGRLSGGAERPAPPFTPAEAPELIGTAVAFHHFNRMVNIFLQESPLPPVRGRVRGAVRRGAAGIMGRLAGGGTGPGGSLDLLPPAVSPPGLEWAAGQPHIAEAARRALAAVEDSAARSVPEQVRQLVTDRLATGPPPGPGPVNRPWLAEVTAGLPDEHRPAARLALLTAFASYQVTDAVVAECRARGQDDTELITLTGWAALSAARQVGTRLYGDLTTCGVAARCADRPGGAE